MAMNTHLYVVEDAETAARCNANAPEGIRFLNWRQAIGGIGASESIVLLRRPNSALEQEWVDYALRCRLLPGAKIVPEDVLSPWP